MLIKLVVLTVSNIGLNEIATLSVVFMLSVGLARFLNKHTRFTSKDSDYKAIWLSLLWLSLPDTLIIRLSGYHASVSRLHFGFKANQLLWTEITLLTAAIPISL